MLNQILRVFILDFRGRENHKILSVGEGMASLVNGEADFGSLCVIVIDDLGGDCPFLPFAWDELLYLIFCSRPTGFLYAPENIQNNRNKTPDVHIVSLSVV